MAYSKGMTLCMLNIIEIHALLCLLDTLSSELPSCPNLSNYLVSMMVYRIWLYHWW